MPSNLPAVGDHAMLQHRFSLDDIRAFAALSGDRNEIHLNEAAARRAGFEGPVVHGILVASLLSRILGTILPGPGTVYLGQELTFRRPVYPGREVSAAVEVLGVRDDKPIVELRTWVEVDGETAIDGRAVVLVR